MKSFPLATYYSSPRAYRMLKSFFCLPAVSTLDLWLRKIYLGWNILTSNMKLKGVQMKNVDTLCGTVFDAMHISEEE